MSESAKLLIIGGSGNPKREQRKGILPSHFVVACDFACQFLDAKAADDDHIPMVLPETGGTSGPAAPRRRPEIVDPGMEDH